MSEFKGTKTNWIVDYKTENTFVIKSLIVNGEIARVFSESEITQEQMHYNAKLISCAPQMLKMLKKVLEENHCTPDLDKEIQQLIKKSTTL